MITVEDDVDERVRQAGAPDAAAVERVRRTALMQGSPLPSLRRRRYSVPIAVAAVSLVGFLALGAWWMQRPPSVAPARPAALGDVITVRAQDGTTWIFSTNEAEEWLPAGSGVVIAGGDAR